MEENRANITPADQDYYLEVGRLQQVSNKQLDEEEEEAEEEEEEEDYLDDYAVPTDDSCQLERSQVELVQLIGEGQKGYVFLGKLQSRDGLSVTDVAVKTLRYETPQLIEQLMREAATMRQLEHPHIVRFVGVCRETPALIAMELAQLGELRQYLRAHRRSLAAGRLVLFAFQLSTALSYLESKQLIHRDVAARNVLVCSHTCVKLADFGLARSLPACGPTTSWPPQLLTDDKGGQYVAAPRVKLPVRWLAPESLALRRFSSASDVWMFAVCTWELFQLGQVRPWAHLRNREVLAAIEAGERLERPPSCPWRLYRLLLQCWSYAASQRPSFRELKQTIWSVYLHEQAREQAHLERRRELLQLARHRAQRDSQVFQVNQASQPDRDLQPNPSRRLGRNQNFQLDRSLQVSQSQQVNHSSPVHQSPQVYRGSQVNQSPQANQSQPMSRDWQVNHEQRILHSRQVDREQQIHQDRQVNRQERPDWQPHRAWPEQLQPAQQVRRQRQQVAERGCPSGYSSASTATVVDLQSSGSSGSSTAGSLARRRAATPSDGRRRCWRAGGQLLARQRSQGSLEAEAAARLARRPLSSELAGRPAHKLRLEEEACSEELAGRLGRLALAGRPEVAMLSSEQRPASAAELGPKATPAQEEARRVALHRRLLGHVRRRSVQLEPDSVDQSLRLLESLIADEPARRPPPSRALGVALLNRRL